MTIDEVLDRRIPLAIVCALLLQAGTAVWWAATKDSDDRSQQARIIGLEQEMSHAKESQSQIAERLARIEERINAEMASLERIEKQVGALRR